MPKKKRSSVRKLFCDSQCRRLRLRKWTTIDNLKEKHASKLKSKVLFVIWSHFLPRSLHTARSELMIFIFAATAISPIITFHLYTHTHISMRVRERTNFWLHKHRVVECMNIHIIMLKENERVRAVGTYTGYYNVKWEASNRLVVCIKIPLELTPAESTIKCHCASNAGDTRLPFFWQSLSVVVIVRARD